MTLSRQSKNVSLLTGSTGLSRMLLTAYKVKQKMISDSKVLAKHPFRGKSQKMGILMKKSVCLMDVTGIVNMNSEGNTFSQLLLHPLLLNFLVFPYRYLRTLHVAVR